MFHHAGNAHIFQLVTENENSFNFNYFLESQYHWIVEALEIPLSGCRPSPHKPYRFCLFDFKATLIHDYMNFVGHSSNIHVFCDHVTSIWLCLHVHRIQKSIYGCIYDIKFKYSCLSMRCYMRWFYWAQCKSYRPKNIYV